MFLAFTVEHICVYLNIKMLVKMLVRIVKMLVKNAHTETVYIRNDEGTVYFFFRSALVYDAQILI